MPQTVYLIDTFSLLFQVFHAIPPMTGPAGQPTNALFGFSRDILSLVRDRKPDWLICAMDSEGPNLRNEIYPAYKGNRTEMPEDLRPQIPLLKDLLAAFRVPVMEAPGWEADDVIATLTRHAVDRGFLVRIVTSDKDARQLLGPSVEILNLRKNSVLTVEGLREDWGILPEQVVDFQSLVGDAVDNVPGIPLVGPKKAAQLLQSWGTLEGVLAHAAEAPGAKLRENLVNFAEQARTSEKLVRLNQHLPLELSWDDCRLQPFDVPRLQELFRGLGFRRMIDEAETVTPKRGNGQRSLFDDPDPPQDDASSASDVASTLGGLASAKQRNWKVVDTTDEFDRLLETLRGVRRLALDLETTGVDPLRCEIVGWAIAWNDQESAYIPVLGPEGSTLLDPARVVEGFRSLLQNPELEWVNQNLKYDLIVLRGVGIEPASLGVDPMVGDYLLDAGARSHNLEVLMMKYLGRQGISISELIGTGKNQITMDRVEVRKVAEYASEDAEAAWELAELIGQQLKSEGLWDLYWDLERPLIPVLADLEERGIRVDAEELSRQSAEAGLKLEELMGVIHGLAGREFNIDSPLQLRKILFDELKLPIKKKTKTGPSTDQDVLEELAALHELPAKIIEHRQLTKLKGTYLDALPTLVHPVTGRIHTSFNQVVAATGRLSSSDPNLQNIPIRTEEGRRIRRAFRAGEPGWKLVCADYSQIELRMLAHFSGDVALHRAFAEGIDIHAAVASDVYHVPLADVDSEQRRVAKAVNFGVLYGQSSYGLAAALGISNEEAASFIEGYFKQYAEVTAFLEELLDRCHADGYARTLLGRRRRIEGIRPAGQRNRNRNMAERTAINTVIQGSAADLIKRAMLGISARLRKEAHPGKMLLQIHDELVFEAPNESIPRLVELIHEEMEHALPLGVPLVVDVSTGENWLDQVDYEPGE